MDTTRITDPISDRLPATGSIVSTVTDATAGLADHVTGHLPEIHLPEIDVDKAVRRTRRSLSGVVPWISPGSRRSWISRRWLLVGAALAVAVTVALVLRRRSESSDAQPGRDDWSTANPSTNGAMPTSSMTPPEREHADTRTST